MEKNSWKTVKEDTLDGKSSLSNKSKLHEPWDYRSHFNGEDLYSGFSWPPRSYTCSFCKREFRSAQALGGHMNVHRRDRARLRQSPPWEPQTSGLNPNPNQSFTTFSPSTRVYTYPSMLTSSLPCFSSPSSTCPSSELKTSSLANSLAPNSTCSTGLSQTMKNLKGFMQEDENNTLKKGKTAMLDLEIGLSNDVTIEDLDLELRLGYS